MNAPEAIAQLVQPTEVAGGFFVGRIRVGDTLYGIVVAPKPQGEHDPIAWNKTKKAIPGARSYCDGFANTEAMAAAGSPLALWARGLRIAGYDDWYLPSRDELELCYRALKPGTYTCNQWRGGDNPSSVPAGYPYTEELGQTAVEAFRTDAAQAFDENWYWTSTQFVEDGFAWSQYFSYGTQSYDHKDCKLRARSVRRYAI